MKVCGADWFSARIAPFILPILRNFPDLMPARPYVGSFRNARSAKKPFQMTEEISIISRR